jgi:hypothetical protein
MIGMAAPTGQRLRRTIATYSFVVIPGQRDALDPESMNTGGEKEPAGVGIKSVDLCAWVPGSPQCGAPE